MEKVDPAEAAAFLRKKEERRQKLLDDRFERANEDCVKIIGFIIKHYSPKRIYRWGSLLRRERFSEISDIDIAVEGLSGFHDVLEIHALAEEITSFPVDIVEMERINPLHRDSIRRKGKCVYERSD